MRVPVFTMAVAAGAAVANIYYCQPMLGVMTRDFPGMASIAFIPTATQLGYALGLFLLVPLGDQRERRSLIVMQFLAIAVALALAALAPTAGLLLAASFVVGACATVAQQVVPFAAHLAPEARRGSVIGTVMAGLLCGILLSRTVSGFTAQHFGYRAMFWAAVPLALVLALLMRMRLPESRPAAGVRYSDLMRSLAGLWTGLPTLRRAAFTQALLFAAFSAFWSTLAFRLEEPQFHLGADVAGGFGIIGAIGVLAAPLAGRLADKRGPAVVVRFGALLGLASWVVLGFWSSIVGLILGVVLLDFAVQSCLIANQTLVYALRPDARSRVNTLFMGTMFLGGSAGSALAAAAYRSHAWLGVSLLGGIVTLVASGLQMGRPKEAQHGA